MEIEDVKKMKLGVGDTLVVKLAKNNMTSHKALEWGKQVKDALHEQFPNNHILVLFDGIELEVLSKETI